MFMPRNREPMPHGFSRSSKTKTYARLSASVTEALEGRRLLTVTPTFSAPMAFTVGNGSISVIAVDLNADKNMDFVTAGSQSGTITIRRGRGDGTFRPATTITVGSDPTDVIAADFNKDGKIDLAVAVAGTSQVKVYLGSGDGATFTASATLAGGDFAIDPGFDYGTGAKLAVGDFDGGGKLDLAVINPKGAKIATFLGSGTGAFSSAVFTQASPFAVTGIATGDFNHDGKTDIAVSGAYTLQVFFSTTGGTLSSSQIISVDEPGGQILSDAHDVIAADLNGDNQLDLAIVSGDLGAGGVFFGTPSGQFTFASDGQHIFVTAGAGYDTPTGDRGPNALVAADLNGDSTIDLAVSNVTDNTRAYIINNGNTSWSTIETPTVFDTVNNHPPTQIAVNDVAAGDFNNDGRIDLLFAQGGGSPYVELMLNTTTGNAVFPPSVDAFTGIYNTSAKTIALSASASETNGSISSVDFYGGGAGMLGTGTLVSGVWTLTIDASSLSTGDYTFYAVANDANTVSNFGQTTVSVINTAPVVVSIVATDATATEPASSTTAATDLGVYTISRTGPTTAALIVNYAIATGVGQATNGTDYNLITGSVTIPIGQLSAPITITPKYDSIIEGSENVQLTLTDNAAYAVGTPGSATITIADNDAVATTVGWYKLDEQSGTTAADSSGNANTATLFNGPTFSAGKSGNALTLNGSTQFATAANVAAIDPTAAITLSAWINPTDWSGNRRILQKGLSDNQYRLLAESGLLKFDLKGVGSVTAALPSVNVWHLVTGTYDGAKMTLYVDGVAVVSAAKTGTIAMTADALFIGAKKSGDTATGNFFKGKIDDVRLYGRALTAAEVQALAGVTVDTTKPTTPGTPTLVSKTDTSVSIKWAASTDNIGVARYDVFRNANYIGSATSAAYTDSGRTASTTYTYAVQAFDAAGNSSSQSGGLTVTTDAASATAPVAWYKFDEVSGTSAADSSGNGNTATLVNGPTFVAGQSGNALTLNGSTQLAQTANKALLNPTSAITLSAWVNATDWSGNRRIIQKGATDNQYRLLAEKGLLKFDLRGVGTITATLPSVGVFHLITGTYDGSTMTLYIDGVSVKSANFTGLIATTTDPLYIGAKIAGDTTAGNFFKGKIDDVRIYAKAITPATVKLAAADDTFITEQATPFGGPTSNHGSSTTLEVEGSNSFRSWSLVKFDLSTLTSVNLSGTTATLSLFLSGSYPEINPTQVINIHQVLVPWQGDTVTLANFGGDLGVAADEIGPVLASQTVSWLNSSYTYVSWTIPTSVITGWLNSPSTNYGLMIESPTQQIHNDLRFDSKEGLYAPQLSFGILK